jgi:hypothetical protein
MPGEERQSINISITLDSGSCNEALSHFLYSLGTVLSCLLHTQIMNNSSRLGERLLIAAHSLFYNLLDLVVTALDQKCVHRLQLKLQPDQSLRERIVQVSGQALAFGKPGQGFNLRRSCRQPLVRLL